MSWWEYIPAVISAVGSITSYSSGKSQNERQLSYNAYNTVEGYKVSMANIDSAMTLGKMNAMMLMNAAELKTAANSKAIAFNADMIRATTAYNDLLYEEDLSRLWEDAGLDQQILHLERARERGAMEATQAASGTLMGQDSNADVIADQMTMEALDSFVIQRNADSKAKDILNARARSLWEGEMSIRKIMWEGELDNYVTTSNARSQAAGSMLETLITGQANQLSAKYQLQSGLISGQNTFAGNNTQLTNAFSSGMFGAVGQGIETYYRNESRQRQSEAGKSLLANE